MHSVNVAAIQIPPRSAAEFRQVGLHHSCQFPSATFCHLTVAITKFRQNYKVHLLSDAAAVYAYVHVLSERQKRKVYARCGVIGEAVTCTVNARLNTLQVLGRRCIR